MRRFKWMAGDALLRVAQFCATHGRRLLEHPRVLVVGDHPQGSQWVTLDTRLPLAILRGVKLTVGNDIEIRKVVAIEGRRIRLDCPTVHAYPHGAEAFALI